MNKYLYKNKSSLLKLKRAFNSFFKIEITKYPTEQLSRRIALLHYHKIDVILDVGANIGQYGAEMRNIGFEGDIFSFEPMTKAFQLLEKTASKDPKWNVLQFSLGEIDGQTNINISKNSVSSSLLDQLPQLTESAPEAVFLEKEMIQIRKLDTIFETLNINNKKIYLKIDTQGYEEMVLQGAENCLKNIIGIQIEMAFEPSYKGSLTYHEMKSKLKTLGFQLHAIENGFFDKKTGKQLEVDGIFFR
ncbi:FkbM family methyltransferase [Flavobacterium taihuense]|uniref:FkbM family methyltransferase n=1 Tax=Flavobacterium taihuense TaxID=2857508 RepID=A0ABS6XQG8_9FLAO|nr:FkbM family methyltransferase [Flavobacterium taihuense]MBW4358930.1 FkbM family methyltransferase [Flavobacterium taihuense]